MARRFNPLVICLLCTSCTPPARISDVPRQHSPATAPASSPAIDPVVLRTQIRFARALFVKPDADRSAVTGLAMALAPLIVQEVSPNGGWKHLRPGRLTDAGIVDSLRLTVYLLEQKSASGRTVLTYAWAYAQSVDAAKPAWRGVRLWLDKDGYPGIAEALDPGGGPPIFFVSRSLDGASVKSSGASVRPVDPARAVVARVIDDGPMPMGPTVYLDESTRRITTLICRCQASQYDETVDAPYYELVRWPREATELFMSLLPLADESHRSPDHAEKLLRLPVAW